MIDLREKGALGDRLFRRIAEVEAHQHEGDRDADGLCDAGQDDAGHNAEENDVCRREDDGGRKAKCIGKEGEQKGEEDCALAEGVNVLHRRRNITAGKQGEERGEKLRCNEMDDDKEKNDGECRTEFEDAHALWSFHVSTSS